MLHEQPMYNMHVVFNRVSSIARLYKQLLKYNLMPRSSIIDFITTQYELDYDAIPDSGLRDLFCSPSLWKTNNKKLFDSLDAKDFDEPKTLKFHKRCNKDYPLYGIVKGQAHYSWSVNGTTVRSLTNPFKALTTAPLQEAA